MVRRKIQVSGTWRERLGLTPWDVDAELKDRCHLLSVCLWLPRKSSWRLSADTVVNTYGDVPVELWPLNDYADASSEEREAGHGRLMGRAFVRYVREYDSATGGLLGYHWAVCRERGYLYSVDFSRTFTREELTLERLADLSDVPIGNAFTWTPEWAQWLPELHQPTRGLFIWARDPLGWHKVHSELKTLIKVYDPSAGQGVHNIRKHNLSRYCITEEQLLALREERGIDKAL